MKQSAKIPGPDKYLCNVHRTEFNDIKKKSRIYTSERKSCLNDIAIDAKKNPKPGVGKYEKFAYDEKRLKPARGVFRSRADKYSVVDE